MIDNIKLREEVRLIKVYYGISYKTFAALLNIKTNSMYNWLCGKYEFSDTRAEQLKQLIKEIKR